MALNQLIIIGNGFDIAHELKTKYQDFILWYLNKSYLAFQNQPEQKYETELIQIFKLSTNPNLETIESFKSLDEFKSFRKSIQQFISINPKGEFFIKIVENAINYNWVDIEQEYFTLLKKRYDSSKKNEHPNVLENLKSLNNSFENLKNEFIKYLKATLKNDITPLEEIKEHLTKISSKARKKTPSHFIPPILFLNFNYTQTIKLYLNGLSNNLYKINNIHGELDNDKNPIIFGYGDEIDGYYQDIENTNNDEYLKHIKSFGYFQTKNYQNLTDYIDSGAYDVHIMGHSCGLSDRVLLSSIFENKNCQSIHIYYWKKDETKNDFTEKTYSISRHFRHENKGRMRNLIVPFEEMKNYPLTNSQKK